MRAADSRSAALSGGRTGSGSDHQHFAQFENRIRLFG
jgi:hypothetical protein